MIEFIKTSGEYEVTVGGRHRGWLTQAENGYYNYWPNPSMGGSYNEIVLSAIVNKMKALNKEVDGFHD